VDKVEPLLFTVVLRWKWLERRKKERKKREKCQLGRKTREN
jgi:hypothetical protein